MRGRTLNDAFIILDESQNTTAEQMKMFLTRIGFGSTVVVTGDMTQIDLPSKTQSGLRHAIRVLGAVEGISFTHFGARDVVRHPLVQRIVEAYQIHEEAVSAPFCRPIPQPAQASPSTTFAKTRGSAMVRSSALVNLSPLGGRYASEFETLQEA